ncbi:S-layer homology domain-containing protein [Nodosilinea sp. LEGE 06152]|uniref:S-layer homology domain-containing protein n=1 Tax=Nodosilinea sp. LEGE 06152 TaxID=2777966 RepID=UPI0018814D3A|nr:S-layer homology domain-containing protein [Nodosilinea sp. LEGE 06152]MBE9157373.1 S-layer homology domain-containing protein [Nodosilinea sp. LEGE 06152]
MVNLPPDQPNSPDPSRPAGESSPRGNRILDFDELLAVVLAFVGIGSILWWGLSRTQTPWAVADRLQRRGGDPPALGQTEAEEETDEFEPRTLERSDRPRQDIPDRDSPSEPRPERLPVNRAIRPESVLVPAAPATVLTTPPDEAEATTQPLDISDVPSTHWAYPFIKSMFDQGYLPDFPESGFQPDQPLTRAELAALISQAFGDAPREGSVIAFTDVPDTYWAAPAIANAVSQNFMNGYPEGDFRPDQAVPRYEVLVSLATGLNLEPSPAPDQTLQSFVDAGPLPDWARAKVAAATENGLVVNYPQRDQLKPAQAATRAEIVAMIHQALVARGELPAVESEYTVP